MKIGNFKIGLRLGIGFGIVVIIPAIVGIHSIFEMRTLADLTAKMYRYPLTVSNAVRDIRANINAMHRSMKDVALAGNIEQINQAAAVVDEYEKEVYKDFEIVFERFLGDMEDVKNARQSFSDWKVIRDEVIDLSKQGKRDMAVDITRGKGARHVDSMNEDIQAMIDFAGSKADSFFKDAQTQKKHIIYQTAGLILTMFVLGLIVALLITKSIVKPLNFIVKRIKDISEGDLKHEVNFYSSDEVGELADSFRELRSDLQHKANIAERIASGDFNEDIPPRSEKDELGKSFYAMTTSLRKATEENKKHCEHFEQLVMELEETNKQLKDEITERKRMDEEINRLMNEIEQDITERKKAEEERLQKEKLQGVLEMAGATCHEFNQPMQVISGYSELLQSKITDDNPFKKQLRILKQQIDRMGELTRKLQNITEYEIMEYVDSKIIDINKASKKD